MSNDETDDDCVPEAVQASMVRCSVTFECPGCSAEIEVAFVPGSYGELRAEDSDRFQLCEECDTLLDCGEALMPEPREEA